MGKETLESMLEFFANIHLNQMIFSNPVKKDGLLKVRVRPVMLKGEIRFQAEELAGNQAFHRNLERDELPEYTKRLLEEEFRQLEVDSRLGRGTVLVGKRGTVTVKVKRREKGSCQGTAEEREQKLAGRPEAAGEQRSAEMPKVLGERDLTKGAAASQETWKEETAALLHNRQKRYVLQEGIPVPFLVDLGVMTGEGRVVRARYDKFRQINRFLEFIEDVLPRLDKERENTIIDFGCGKSYLTFAMYHYLNRIQGYPIQVIGLDLKKDVIARCNLLAEKYGYDRLAFYHGDIANYEGVDQVDMVVTLHACDTATDYALAKAVRWKAKVILSVPCCQHELNGQMKNEMMRPVFRYGVIKERMAALYTDGLRAEILEREGYRTQILEFIDMEHTPKNLLIRAVRTGKKKDNEAEIQRILDFLQIRPTLWRLLEEDETT